MSSVPSLSVLVVAYGRPDLLARALCPLARRFALVVVDNSRDADVEAVVLSAGALYLRPDRNLGFARAVNLGLARIAEGRDVLLLNPDAVIDAESVLTLQQSLRQSDSCAAVSPVLLRPDGTHEPSQWPMPTPATVWAGALGLAAKASSGVFLPGAVLLLRAEALAQVGAFDERYFLYSEETDWQVRATHAGWTVHVVPTVTAEHIGGATSSDTDLRERLFHGSAELFARKWFGSTGWWLWRAGSMVAAARRLLTARSPQRRAEQRRILALYARGPVRSLPEWARFDGRAA